MKKAKARELLERLVKEIDYDIYKQLFVDDCMEDPEMAFAEQERLLDILGDYINIE